MAFPTPVLAFVAGLFSLQLASCQQFQLDVSASGSFTITLDGNKWLGGSEVGFGSKTASSGVLKPSGYVKGRGEDQIGSYESQTISWSSEGNSTHMETSFRTYPSDGGVIVFEQKFLSDSTQNDRGSSGLSAGTLFPAFDKSGKDTSSLDCFAYHGVFPTLKACNITTYQESHQGGAPIIIYDSTKSNLPMSVFSPLNQPKAHHMASNSHMFGAGVKESVDLIPAGWSQLFILTAGTGINTGMMAWGDRMLKFTGKPRADMYYDATHSAIGYWTDNGGYYHYDTGPGNKTYEQVLPEVKAYHDRIGVPFKHWQFDSWFYPKDGGVNPGGGGGAVTNWTALPSVFPSGMAGINQKLGGMPTVMHNRQWSIRSDYIKNEPFEWYTSQKAAVPKDPEAFFTWFFKQQEGWGLSMYEQDWMCTEYDEVEALQTNITLGDMWLAGMAAGVASSNRTQQYCMPYANDILSASAYPAVTNARASRDYVSEDQWSIGGTSLFYWAIGILPFKDGFYSSNLPQTGGQTSKAEANPDRAALMATLSCAMVGPMDGLNLLNKTRVMTTCRSDGYVLKPDRPVMTSDYCFLNADPSCLIYQTFSSHGNYGTIHYHYNDKGDEIMEPRMVDLKPNDEYVVYNWYTGALNKLGEGVKIEAGYEGHSYAVVSPLLRSGNHAWAFIGEVDKYVTASKFRFSKIKISVHHFSVTVKGIQGETVQACAAYFEQAGNHITQVCVPTKIAITDRPQVIQFNTPKTDMK